MSSAVRLAVTALVAALVAVSVLVLATRSSSGLKLQAEFANAHGLVPGNDVRIDGAPAGRVDDIELTDDGTALVTLRLNDGLKAPRSDASAAIRPVDLLGDTYVALSPGTARAPLQGRIRVQRTLNAPRLDDLLRVFRADERAGFKTMLVELGLALDRRGVDLNRAALALRPALDAADGVMRELGSQTADLRSVIADAERVTAQATARNADLGQLVDTFAATLSTTADHARGIDRGLERMPATLGQLDRTATGLAATARAARPLAGALNEAAPRLAEAADRLEPFLTQTTRAASDLRPTLRRAAAVLQRGEPTLNALADGLAGLDRAAPDANGFLKALVPAAPAISEGFFVNFPDQASEPGTQPFDPFADTRRHYWRGAAVFSCEAFGLKVKPGCLADFLRSVRASEPKRRRTPQRSERPQRAPVTPALPVKTPKPVGDLIDTVKPPVKQVLDQVQGLLPQTQPGLKKATDDVLDLLLGP